MANQSGQDKLSSPLPPPPGSQVKSGQETDTLRRSVGGDGCLPSLPFLSAGVLQWLDSTAERWRRRVFFRPLHFLSAGVIQWLYLRRSVEGDGRFRSLPPEYRRSLEVYFPTEHLRETDVIVLSSVSVGVHQRLCHKNRRLSTDGTVPVDDINTSAFLPIYDDWRLIRRPPGSKRDGESSLLRALTQSFLVGSTSRTCVWWDDFPANRNEAEQPRSPGAGAQTAQAATERTKTPLQVQV